MLEPFSYAFALRGLWEVALLSVGAGVLGTWIVMRGLAFYAHAVATAAFPGLVLAAGFGFPPVAGALGTGALMAFGVGGSSTRRRPGHDVVTALTLVGALAGGVILASDVFHSGSEVDTLLFGSLFSVGDGDLVTATAVSLAVLAASWRLGPRWLAVGFDPTGARALGAGSRAPDLVLLGLIALTAVATLAAVGALLVSALLVMPAVTTRLWARRVVGWQVTTVALAALEGAAGVWLSVRTNAPPGATVATLGGAVFLIAAVARRFK